MWLIFMAAATVDWSSASVNSAMSSTAVMEQVVDSDEIPAHLPQWKKDFLEKKRALAALQRERNAKILAHDNGSSHGKTSDYKTKGSNYTTPSATSNSNSKANSNSTSTTHLTMNGSAIRPSEVTTDTASTTDTTDTESLSSAEGDATKISGGYSFVTGETFTPEDSSESASNATDTEDELAYRPGFVHKLLNKWSTISYQAPPVPERKPSRPITLNPAPASAAGQANGKFNNRSEQRSTDKSKTTPEERRPSYRAPNEIILIESPRDEPVNVERRDSRESLGSTEETPIR